MDCTIATLLACLSLNNVYVDGGIQYHDIGPRVYVRDTSALLDSSGNLIQDAAKTRAVDTPALNPYGILSVGYELRFERITWRIEATHFSSLATDKDRGVNAISVSARWFPFR